ncbi:Bifunctional purine biosynthesis protein PurH (Includes: Phosphoribosylaminoimidazolecarboxamide formyltransferase; IMP cyclohydrolase) [uncultured Paludibacter sp.]|uniref:Bifunctional purine biosynthesis protein PurH n=1 Tax=uncultured Paludibacter sp. TaxID=497635 RepID=A0A653AGH3_9BACT|nr:Bifunctional purine biosynthesis protein PurH (Includes: Phosphoribosylaminoimidazolecarboxamide formyltransferase; IMP cyclohydrolase) [uncultured Paludibacter sp.]
MKKKQIKRALISVYHKDKLDEIVKKLHSEGVEFLSTGGTKSFIESLGIPCDAVEDLTSYPSILGGRVKTLHPKVFGGILARREEENDEKQLLEYEIPEIDLVIVDLYPFEETVAAGADEKNIIEKIDIGGISLIRAAAKNYKDVVILASKAQYQPFLELIEQNGAKTTLEERRWFAKEAFGVSSGYDTAIFNYFDGEEQSAFRFSMNDAKMLRYGENPHQKGIFYGKFDEMFEQLQGKEISYNNLLDIDAAVNLINDFDDITFAILKHNNACGLASRPVLKDAWEAALAGDPVSAFGGVLITNAIIDKETAEEINKIFFEVIIAPDYDLDALEILTQKKNRIILVLEHDKLQNKQFRSILNGVLMQDKDTHVETPHELKIVTQNAPTEKEIEDLLFANKIVKHSKSNAIVLAKNKQMIASGVGQTSRVDALKHAIEKANSFGFNLEGCVMASDAFFPFPDCVEIGAEIGISSIIQPGGSINDDKSIEACNKAEMAMVTTGYRHFKH